MKRQFSAQLTEWKEKKNRKPLILQGARQVGKTTLITQFGKTEFPNLHIFNFEKNPELMPLFEGMLDPKQILARLEVSSNKQINPTRDLLFFDEIQECPRALTSLKYFAEDLPESYLVTAGSLLGLSLSDHSFPVGKVQMETLYPLSFSEFNLWQNQCALAENLSLLSSSVRHSLEKNVSLRLENPHHALHWESFKRYLIFGGMPEVVAGIQGDSWRSQFEKARETQSQILRSYLADMAKHSGKTNAMHLERMLRSIPSQMLRDVDGQTPKYVFSDVVPGIRSFDRLASVLDWLQKAGLVYQVKICNSGEQPSIAFTQNNFFKLNFFDCGLLGCLGQLEPSLIQDFQFGTYKGFFAENFVLTELRGAFSEICCWREGSAEVEFLLPSKKGPAMPIEVKSGHRTKTKSLAQYLKKYSPNLAVVFSAQDILSFDKTSNILRLPVYMAAAMLPK